MESRFGADFGAVRVHADRVAADAAERVDAQAFAVGQDVVFGRGRYQPNSPKGQRLLAHELAHTLQQRNSAEPTGSLRVSSPGETHESTASAAAESVARGDTPSALGHTERHLARQPDGAPEDEESDEVEDEAEPKETAEPVDTMAGAEVFQIVLGLGNSKVAFLTSKGAIFGTVSTDLKAGSYEISPDYGKQKWNIHKNGIKSGLRFYVRLNGALPWTLGYPEELLLTVSPGPLDVEAIKAAVAAEQAVAEQEKEKARIREEIHGVDPMAVREQWSEKKDAFLEVASDSTNTLNAHQMYQIWLRYWMGRQSQAHRAVKDLEASLKAAAEAEGSDALVIFFDNKMLFEKGKRSALGKDYEAAVEQRETADFVISELKDVLDWLEVWVDSAGHHVTLADVNAKAVEIAKAKQNFRIYMAPLILGVIAWAGAPAAGRTMAPKGEVNEPVPEKPADPAAKPAPPAGAPAAAAAESMLARATGPGVAYGEALAQRLKGEGKSGPAIIRPVVEELNANTALGAADKAAAAQSACNSQGKTFGAGPVIRMPNGDLVVTSRLPLRSAPVIVVRANGSVVRGTADIALTADKTSFNVTNVRVKE